MTTQTLQVPNQAVDNPGVWFPKNDGNWALAAGIVGAFACHEAATPNMTVKVDTGAISFAGQVPTVVGQQTSATITAPATNPRKDIVVIDANTGTMSIITGAENASPVDPAITEGKIPVARINMATSTTSITNALIDDLRAPVFAVQGSPLSLAVSTNATLTQKQAGMSVYLSGTTVTCTLPSPTGCKGARFTLIGTDANTQTISASLRYPDGSTASSHSITNDEILSVESNGSLWHVIDMAGKQIIKNSASSTQQPVPRAQADSLYVAAGAAAGGDLVGTYPNPTLTAAGPGATGPIGNSTTVPVITIDAKGRVTGLSSTPISFPAAGVSSFNTRTGAVTLAGSDLLLSPGAVGSWAYGASTDAGVGCTVGNTTTLATCGGGALTGTWKNMGPSTVGVNVPSNTTMLQRVA